MHYFLAHRAKFKGTFFSSFFWKSLLNSFANPLFSSFLPYIFISLIFGHSFTYATYLCLRHITSFRMFFCISTARFYLKNCITLYFSLFFISNQFSEVFCRYFQDQGNPVALEMLEEGIFSVMFCTIFSFFFSQQNLIV